MTVYQSRIDRRIAAKVGAYTVEHGGGTFDAVTGDPFIPSIGYGCGMADGTAAFQPDATALYETGRRVAQEFNASFFGTWIDERTGLVHVDPAAYIIGYDRAVSFAREHGQIALYNFSTKTVEYIESEVQS